MIVENKGGASGSIGTGAVAHGAADGYSYAVVFDTHGIEPDPDAQPAVRHQEGPGAGDPGGHLADGDRTPVASEYKTFGDVVAAAKAKKNVSFGTVGSGSLGHLAMSLLGKSAGLEMTHVPYKGGGPLMQDVVAGHVPLSIATVFVTKPHIDSKRLRPLAVTTSKRSPELPDVPTLAESGFPGFEAPAWWGVLASAKTPPEIVKRMNEELNKALKVPDIAQKLAAQGITVVGGSPEVARTFIDKQIDTWAVVVKENNIKAE